MRILRGWLRRWVVSQLDDVVAPYLRTRAFRLPERVIQSLAARLDVSPDTVREIADSAAQHATERLIKYLRDWAETL